MARTVAIGKQDFASIMENHYFFVDKTEFIREWWESGDDVTLITRPRRFGKTLNMSMVNCFFSNRYANRRDLFEALLRGESIISAMLFPFFRHRLPRNSIFCMHVFTFAVHQAFIEKCFIVYRSDT